MLIEFSISNFRSFRERQVFSMVAEPRLRRGKENLVSVDVDEKLPKLLKVAAIYGPNASGKSTFLKALYAIARLTRREPGETTKLPVQPFRFDPELTDKPSRFELNFIAERCRYQFELAMTMDRVVEERLTAYPKGKESLLYDRRLEEGRDVYTFGQTLEGGNDVHETWRKLTGPSTLFISQATANSSEDLQQLRIPFKWLRQGFFIVDHDMPAMASATQRLAMDSDHLNETVSSFLFDLDVPVKEMRFETIPPENSAVSETNEKNKKFQLGKNIRTTLVHSSALGEASFDISEESDGTRSLIGFWLPWAAVANGRDQSPFKVLLVDELDSSLHPEIVARLIEMHQTSDRAIQMIFTTHDTHLMDTKLLRRDQIWLTERDQNGATQLRSIHDFEGRESEDIEKRYFEGRYRALPILRKF